MSALIIMDGFLSLPLDGNLIRLLSYVSCTVSIIHSLFGLIFKAQYLIMHARHFPHDVPNLI